MNTDRGVSEVLIPPRSPLIRTHLFPGMATPSGDLVVLAVQRSGEDLRDALGVLRAGDTLVVSGTWDKLQHHTVDKEVLVVDEPGLLRRGVPLGVGARCASGILLGIILLLATGAVPAVIAGLLAAAAVVLTGVLTPHHAYRSVSWTTVILVGGMTPLPTAFVETGTGTASPPLCSAWSARGHRTSLSSPSASSPCC